MKKLKTSEEFVNTFLYKLMRKSQCEHPNPVFIRFPDGEKQLLEVVQALYPTLKVFDRIHHQGWFEDQSLKELSHIGRRFIKDKDVLGIYLVDGVVVLYYVNWKDYCRPRLYPNADLNARYYKLAPATGKYSIHIKSSNRLQLTEYGKQVVEETFAGASNEQGKKLGNYDCFFNQATGCWQHNQSFGSKKDRMYGTDAGVMLIIRKGHIELSTYADGGMTGLVFSEKDRTAHPKNADDMTINYTLKLAKTLVDAGIVSVPKRWKEG